MSSHLVTRSSSFVLLLASLLVGSGCASAPAIAPPASPTITSMAVVASPPPPSRARVQFASIIISADIRSACGIADKDAHFAFDSAAIQSDDAASLAAVADCFSVGPLRDRSLNLVGRADPRGSLPYNMALGQGRADSVEQYLGAHGVNPGQITATSRGAFDATGTNEEGWAHDRRVDVTLGS